VPVQVLESASQTYTGVTTTQTGPDLVNKRCRGVRVVLDTTAIGTGSITLSIEGKDRASGKYYTLLSGAAVVTNVTNKYTVAPDIPAVANVSARDVLPELWRWKVTAGNSNPATYSGGASTLL
jgi:hypothetical protein